MNGLIQWSPLAAGMHRPSIAALAAFGVVATLLTACAMPNRRIFVVHVPVLVGQSAPEIRDLRPEASKRYRATDWYYKENRLDRKVILGDENLTADRMAVLAARIAQSHTDVQVIEVRVFDIVYCSPSINGSAAPLAALSYPLAVAVGSSLQGSGDRFEIAIDAQVDGRDVRVRSVTAIAAGVNAVTELPRDPGALNEAIAEAANRFAEAISK